MSERTVRTGTSEDVEMYSFRHCSAYTHVHTDISTLIGVLYVLNSEHITYRITTASFHALIAETLFACDAGQLAAFLM